MQTTLSPEFKDTPEGTEAEAILRKCVHCGFCNATCPTYQLLGDELDGPRGRIYLIKQMLEGGAVSRSTQVHLDRCLTCRNCETTCPSGVEYGHLAEIGRRLVEERVPRPLSERMARWVLKEGLTSRLFAPAFRAGQWLRPWLPPVLRNKVAPRRPGTRDPSGREASGAPGSGALPERGQPSSDGTATARSSGRSALPQSPAAAAPASPREREMPDGTVPAGRQVRKVILLRGCVQPAMRPEIDRATVRVLRAAGIEPLIAREQGCCGALRTHLSDHEGGREHMRRNIDAWWPLIESGADAVVVNASGCSQMVKDYGYALRDDPGYAAKAARIAELTRDLCELLPELARALEHRLRPARGRRIAFHSPCTLQHGQEVRGTDRALAALGFDVREAPESHLCCGSAGTYSVLQPALAERLRDRKLERLASVGAECIVSANIGCIQHLQSGTPVPVMHWIEILEEALVDAD
jgi:glycolate oxidase iron-sulfur subunit